MDQWEIWITKTARLVETQNVELTILRKESQTYQDIFQTHREKIMGKRIALKGEFVFRTEEVLKIAKDAKVSKVTAVQIQKGYK
jgi:hypothetical protein